MLTGSWGDGGTARIVERCRAQDQSAWKELYDAHFDFVYRVARRLGTPADEAEDVAHDVFEVVYVEAIASGKWNPKLGSSALPLERPNVFKVYEENIGPLTPLIADALKDAEELYYADWIADAIQLAVTNNKRSWKYCEAILKRWKEEGRAEKQDRRDDKKSGEGSLDRTIEQLRKRSKK